MGKIKGFLFAVRHREILMTDLGLTLDIKKKESFCLPNVALLLSKRTPFTHQKDPFCKPKGVLFIFTIVCTIRKGGKRGTFM